MIKTVTLLKRRADLTPAEFEQHWRETHGPLVLAIPGVRHYVQCRPVDEPGFTTGYDGIAEVYYEDVESMRSAFASQEYSALLDDEVNFMGPSTGETVFLAVDEAHLR